ncbi:hypothetical protein E4T52_09077 [Aureobasidium sp. EXF-3400]|nr:hypothetical protein E4T51_10042 [Aureobasidium sp. EXF-12344]KAI4776006.1 hypothetical protein E4T52_09077 [Aureobasidium sp. EXF-3400]
MPDMDVTPQDFVLDSRRRLASPNERRCIARQDIGHQRRLIVGAVYTSDSHDDVIALKHGKQPFLQALRYCIGAHPLLSTAILDADTEAPEFATPKVLDLDKHLEILVAEDIPEEQYIEKLLAEISDEKFEALHTTPPWKVVLTALPCQETSGKSRLLVLYTNYHSHGDGRSGLAFQDSFYKGLSEYISSTHEDHSSLEGTICKPPTTPLLPPIEEGGGMTLSWSYLLSPLLGTYLPKSIVSYLGLRDSWLSSEADFWRGEKTSFDPENHCTGLVLITLNCSIKEKILQTCRNNHTTFTGSLQHLVARALTAPDGGALSTSTFLAGVAIDMRHLFPGIYSKASMMNCVTGHSELIHSSHLQEPENWASDPSSPFWKAAQKTSKSLKVAAGTLHNQPIGLLQYLKAFRPWTVGLVGKERDMSFEISNLGAFSPSLALAEPQEPSLLVMEKLMFSQPAKASGSLLDFNAVSVEGGPLVLTITWQKGVLGVGDAKEEEDFVRSVCGKLEESLAEIANGGL